MKKALVFLSVLLVLFSMIGCAKDEGLIVWSFTDELEQMITGRRNDGTYLNAYFAKEFPDFKFQYTMTPTDDFQSRLDPVLASGRGAPDVFALEDAFVRKYIESGLLLDLTDIYERNRSKLLAYPAEVGTYNGRVYGMSWQATPGAVFYRRSLAIKYLGTDDPVVVQSYLKDFPTFFETAALLKDRSNDACVIVSGYQEFRFPFYSSRQDPWVVNNRLVIDPMLDTMMEYSKLVYDNRWEGRGSQWSDAWFAGMRGELVDENGRPLEVFCYFLPTWGLHYVLKENAGNTAGDWAMVEGPIGWRWGGTWLAAWKDTKKPDEAKQLIEWLTTNDAFLRQYALDTGDVVSNLNVLNSVAATFVEPFLGGQNHYAPFAAAARNVNGRLTQGTDSAINGLWEGQLDLYIRGEKTKQQAVADFRAAVQQQLNIN